jgi:acetyltransferase-like isoleucine patch superfamily enzyme
MNGAIISTLVKIGKQVIINTRSTIEHHGYIDKGVEIGPCATLCGRVTVNKYSWVCAGATVLPRIIIGKNSIIGASAMVGKNVPDDSVFVGVPAKFLKSNINKI